MTTTGPDAAAGGQRERGGDHLGNPARVVDLEDAPWPAAPNTAAQVDLLEGLAPAVLAGHLTDEQDQRRGVLTGGVHPDRRVRGARARG